MKTNLLLALAIFLLLCSFSCFGRQTRDSIGSSKERQIEIKKSDSDSLLQAREKNIRASRILTKYCEFFGGNVPDCYPPYHGGLFIDKDNNPVILTTDMSKEKLIKEAAGSDEVIVRQCTHPYHELYKLYKRINANLKMKSNKEVLDEISFSYCAISDSENCVEVCIVNSTPDKIALFKSKIADSPMLKFISSDSHFKRDIH